MATSTASFGAGKRENHDSSAFYARRMSDHTPSREKTGLVVDAPPPVASRTDTIGRDAFLDATISVWEIQPESARRVGHSAPFPVELPRRLIELYTFEGDVVLDPFMGAGTTAVAASASGRRYIGYEVNPRYVELAERRLATTTG